MQFYPDSSRILTYYNVEGCEVWDVTTGNLCLRPLGKHIDTVNCATLSLNGACVATASTDQTIHIWDANTGESVREPLNQHSGQVYIMALSAVGRYLASVSNDNTLRMRDLPQESAELAMFIVEGSFWSLCFSPKSNCFLLGSNDGEISFWNISSGGCEQDGEIHCTSLAAEVRSVTFSPNGLSVASGCRENSVKIWTVTDNSGALVDCILRISLMCFNRRFFERSNQRRSTQMPGSQQWIIYLLREAGN